MSVRRVAPPRSSLATAAAKTSGAYRAAREAYLAGRYEVAAAYLQFEPSKTTAERGRVALLRAQIAGALGDGATALATATIAARDHATAGGRLTALAVAARAARDLDDDAQADRLFGRLRRAVGTDVREETALAALALATDAVRRGALGEAETLVTPLLALAHPGTPALAATLAMARGDAHAAAAQLSSALAAADTRAEFGADERASLLRAAARTAAETADLRLGRRARSAYEAFAWPPSLGAARAATLRHLRVVSMLEGNLERAWFEAREAAAVAPGGLAAATAEIDAATASRLIGDDRATRLLFERAWRRLRAERWAGTSEDERETLATFSAEAAREMPAEARQALALYGSPRGRRASRGTVPEPGRRGIAYAAAGRIDEAAGERGRAIEHYRLALNCYEIAGRSLRVAIVAADLFRLTRGGEYRDRLGDVLERAPRAWLLAGRSPADELGPKAREILARLLVGESAKSVAADLGRSTYTVSNHTRRIFEVFEVHSRDRLREKCAELGITPVTLRAR